MKKLLLSLALLLASAPAAALEDDLEQRYRVGQGMTYWGLGSGMVGGAAAVPLTMGTLEMLDNLRRARNPVEACANALMAIIILPPMILFSAAAWTGGATGTGIGLGGSLKSRGALIDAGGQVTPAPAILGFTALAATPPLLIFGLDQEDERLVYSGIGTFVGANAMLLTQGLLNRAEYNQLSTAQRGPTSRPLSLYGAPQHQPFVPTITIGGRF